PRWKRDRQRLLPTQRKPMSEFAATASSAHEPRDAAALSLIDIRRIDRAAGKATKRGDLTDRLKRRPNGEAPRVPSPVTVEPEAAPIAATPVPELPLAAFAPEPPVTRRAPLPEPYVAP